MKCALPTKRGVLCFALLVTISSLTVMADDQASNEWKYRGEIFGGVGFGRFNHGNSHLGSGMDLGAGFGIRPFTGALSGLGFEILANGLAFRKEWSGGEFYNDGSTFTVSGSALYHFGRSGAQFYLLGGLGALTGDYVFVSPYSGTEEHKSTKMAICLGAGVKARITPNLALRPEFRLFDTTIGTGYNWLYLRFSVALAYHF